MRSLHCLTPFLYSACLSATVFRQYFPMNRLPNFLGVLALFLGVLWAPMATAQETISAAVLNLEAEGVSNDLTNTLTSVVRNEAQQIDNYEVVNKVAINFQDILLVLGCSADSTVCLKRAAAELKARMLIFGRVTKKGPRTFQIRLNIFDAQQGKMVNKLAKTVKTDDPVVAFQKEIETFFRRESGDSETLLRIGSNVQEAKVFIENIFVGSVPLERKGLPPGRYAVAVEADGYDRWETVLELKTGADLEIWAPLKEKKVAAAVVVPEQNQQSDAKVTDLKADAKLEDREIKKTNWAAWSAVGVGGLALVGSAVFALLMLDVESTIDEENANGTLTQRRYDELVDRGESHELTHRILLGVGAASVIGGTIWLLVDSSSESSASLEIGTRGTSVEATLRW